ncbi:MAG: pilus assembly protein PilB, partial [Phycisphaeraceae bacterium]|nr:pilus assembly protein PilB [Phycisphaeraceae bacterium]
MAKVSTSELKGRKFGRVLVKLGKVTREQVHEALKAQQGQAGRKVGEILVDLGYITDDDIRAALAGQAGIEQVVLRDREISDETFAAIPATTATTYQIVPIKFDRERNAIAVAVKSPDNFAAVDDLRNLLGFKRVKPVLAAAEEIDEILQERYAAKGSGFSEIYAEAGDSAAIASLEGRGDSLDLDMLEEASGDNAIVRLVQETLLIAIRDKASDIHFEPFEDEFKIRYRIDGVLYEMAPPDKRLALP